MDISTLLNAGLNPSTSLRTSTGLTQALSDGTYTYFIPVALVEWDTYGLPSPGSVPSGRIAQYDTTAEYFLGDALGSVRQLTDAQGQITLAKAYNSYGEVTQSAGAGQSGYGYTGEFQDGYIQSSAPSVHPLSNPLTNTTASRHEICREAVTVKQERSICYCANPFIMYPLPTLLLKMPPIRPSCRGQEDEPCQFTGWFVFCIEWYRDKLIYRSSNKSIYAT
jgi:hypothetical protein